MYIKLPMYVSIYMALLFNDFDVCISITRVMGRALKISSFRAHPFSMALVMDLSRIKIIRPTLYNHHVHYS
jgi:hypothetical protein